MEEKTSGDVAKTQYYERDYINSLILLKSLFLNTQSTQISIVQKIILECEQDSISDYGAG